VCLVPACAHKRKTPRQISTPHVSSVSPRRADGFPALPFRHLHTYIQTVRYRSTLVLVTKNPKQVASVMPASAAAILQSIVLVPRGVKDQAVPSRMREHVSFVNNPLLLTERGHTHTYIHTHTYTYIHIHTHTYTYIHTYICTLLRVQYCRPTPSTTKKLPSRIANQVRE
jgi:hypothetical protein